MDLDTIAYFLFMEEQENILHNSRSQKDEASSTENEPEQTEIKR